MLTGLHCLTKTFENNLEKSGWEYAVFNLKSSSSAIMGTVWPYSTITKQKWKHKIKNQVWTVYETESYSKCLTYNHVAGFSLSVTYTSCYTVDGPSSTQITPKACVCYHFKSIFTVVALFQQIRLAELSIFVVLMSSHQFTFTSSDTSQALLAENMRLQIEFDSQDYAMVGRKWHRKIREEEPGKVAYTPETWDFLWQNIQC